MKRLFIHIPKCAGMSIRHGLRGKVIVAGEGGHKNPEYTEAVRAHMKTRGEHHGFEHARWRDVREDMQRILPAFAIVRNPWARVASRYFFGLQVAKQGKPESKNYTFRSFDEFLDERHLWGEEPYYWHRATRGWYPQLDYVTDEGGTEIKCDILRCEHLAEDLERYAGWTLPPRRRNVTEEKMPYQELYDCEQRKAVADWYQEDVETFGFRFDGAATRNVWQFKS
jgi:hypothetical protein